MRLSVIIPVYNVAPYLRCCVESVLHQTYRNLEIILVDDGSTDESGAICDELAVVDGRIQVIHKPNGGLSDARNAGFAVAKGDYVAFLDSDDYYAYDSLFEELVRNLRDLKYPDLLLFCSIEYYEKFQLTEYGRTYKTEYINSIDRPIEIFMYLESIQRFSMSACFQLIKRCIIVENDIFFVKGLRNEDLDWSINLWRHVDSVKVTNIYGYVYRHRDNSITTTLCEKDYESYQYMFKKWLKELDPQNINDRPYLGYLAYIFPTLLYGYFSLCKNDRKRSFEIIEEISPILIYSNTPKSNRVRVIQKIFGLKITTCIFAFYGSYLKTIIRKLKK